MKKHDLTEQINRIMEMMGVDEKNIITEQIFGEFIDAILKKIAPGFDRKFYSKIESVLSKTSRGKTLATATEDELKIALRSAEMAGFRQTVARQIVTDHFTDIQSILKKYNLMNNGERLKANTEILNTLDVNVEFLNDIKAEYKAVKESGMAPKITTPTTPISTVGTKSIDDLLKGNITINDVSQLTGENLANIKEVIALPGVANAVKNDKVLKDLEAKMQRQTVTHAGNMNSVELQQAEMKLQKAQQKLAHTDRMNTVEYQKAEIEVRGAEDELRAQKSGTKATVAKNTVTTMKSNNQIVILWIKRVIALGVTAAGIYGLIYLINKIKGGGSPSTSSGKYNNL